MFIAVKSPMLLHNLSMRMLGASTCANGCPSEEPHPGQEPDQGMYALLEGVWYHQLEACLRPLRRYNHSHFPFSFPTTSSLLVYTYPTGVFSSLVTIAITRIVPSLLV